MKMRHCKCSVFLGKVLAVGYRGERVNQTGEDVENIKYRRVT
jgi:hypothetical protein